MSKTPRLRWLWFFACAVAVAIPFAVTDFAPLTDLPQHMAQVRMLFEALSGKSQLYRLQWWTPYATAYGVLSLAWWAAPPLLASRLGAALIALLVLGGIHAWAA